VESELEISRKLITRFVKRMYTDKVRGGRGPERSWGCACARRAWRQARQPPKPHDARSSSSLALPLQVIIAFTFLVICGIVGIIVYSTLNPNQKIFNVPDAAKPAIPGVSVSNSPTPSPSPVTVRRLLRAAAGRGGDAASASSTLASSAAAQGSALVAAVRRVLAGVWRAAAGPSAAAAAAAPALRGGGGVAGGGAG
jgi:hypothetical protein